MRIKNQKDFWAGILFTGFGLFFAGFGTQFSMGTATRIGPGYFPTALGAIVILLGVIIMAGAVSAKALTDKVDKFDFPAVLLILGSIVLFGLLLKPLGLIISLFTLICVSSYASHEFSRKATLINGGVLIGLCLVVFIWGLKLELKLWPSFIGN